MQKWGLRPYIIFPSGDFRNLRGGEDEPFAYKQGHRINIETSNSLLAPSKRKELLRSGKNEGCSGLRLHTVGWFPNPKNRPVEGERTKGERTKKRVVRGEGRTRDL